MGWTRGINFVDYGPKYKAYRKLLNRGLSKKTALTYETSQTRDINALMQRLVEDATEFNDVLAQ